MVVPAAALPAAEFIATGFAGGGFPYVAAGAKKSPHVFAASFHRRGDGESVVIIGNAGQITEGLRECAVGVIAAPGRPDFAPGIAGILAGGCVLNGFLPGGQPIGEMLGQLAGGAFLLRKPGGVGDAIIKIDAHDGLAGIVQGLLAKLAAVVLRFLLLIFLIRDFKAPTQSRSNGIHINSMFTVCATQG